MEPQKTFRDFYRALDIKTKRALGFSGFELAIAKAIEQYALNEEQLSKLIRLTTQVIVGFEKKEAFVSKISELLGVTPEISLSIAGDINQKIMLNLLKSSGHYESSSILKKQTILLRESRGHQAAKCPLYLELSQGKPLLRLWRERSSSLGI